MVSRLLSSILMLLLIVLFALLAKRAGRLEKNHSAVLARIVTDIGLPAMIFVHLAQLQFTFSNLLPAFLLLGTELLVLCLSFAIARSLKCLPEQIGPIVLCSTFGSSAFLGYSLIAVLYPNQPEVLAEAVIISEIGVGYPVLILGPLLAKYFSGGGLSSVAVRGSLVELVRSPISLAMASGLLWGYLQLPTGQHWLLEPFFHVGSMLAATITPLALIAVGLLIEAPKLKSLIVPFAIVVVLKLLLSPLLCGLISFGFEMPQTWRYELVIFAGMPPAVVGMIFLRRYGGNAELAANLFVSATILSPGTLMLALLLLG